MSKGLSPAITIRLAIIALLIGALLVFSHRPTLLFVTDALGWYTEPSVAVSLERQQLTALHEAAHVVASETLRGSASVHGVKVYTGVPVQAKDTTYGQSDVDMSIRDGSRTDTMNVVVILLAGAHAEMELLKRESDSSGSDIKTVGSVYVSRYTDDPDAIARGIAALQDEKEILEVLDMSKATSLCAQSVVQTNDKVIKALGEEIMRQPEHFNRRQMNEEQLRAFFAAHPVQKPYTVCDF